MANYIKLLLAIVMLSTISLITFPTDKLQAKDKKLKYKENSVLALNYHRIRNDNFLDDFLYTFSNSKEMSAYSINKSQFESQIKWLKEHDANFITQKELIKYKEKGDFPQNSVWVNFDDMDESIYRNAHPILEKYNVPATGFVITGEIGSRDFHNLNILHKKELQKMKDSDLWEFQSHTHNLHTLEDDKSLLIKASDKALTKDIKQSNHYLKSQLDEKNDSIAYPYGQIESEKIEPLKKGGIRYGYTLEEKVIEPDDHDYYMPRILINEESFNKLIKNWKGFKDE
ncbi:intercellular adhesin biosynthesis polysaccharide N-deacetylase [Staphylococcus aureus]